SNKISILALLHSICPAVYGLVCRSIQCFAVCLYFFVICCYLLHIRVVCIRTVCISFRVGTVCLVACCSVISAAGRNVVTCGILLSVLLIHTMGHIFSLAFPGVHFNQFKRSNL